jgi:hypothetical protein
MVIPGLLYGGEYISVLAKDDVDRDEPDGTVQGGRAKV